MAHKPLSRCYFVTAALTKTREETRILERYEVGSFPMPTEVADDIVYVVNACGFLVS